MKLIFKRTIYDRNGLAITDRFYSEKAMNKDFQTLNYHAINLITIEVKKKEVDK